MASKALKLGMKTLESPDYHRLAILDRRYDEIKKSIFLRCRDLGVGTSRPVAYDTGWVARIPDVELFRPAFPSSSQWLRDNQNQDGSWGDSHLACSGVLNTLSAVLGLSQWNHHEDQNRIQAGLQAVHTLAERLPLMVTKSFEILIAGLVDEAFKLELDLPLKNLERFRKTGLEELKKMEKFLLTNRHNKFWTYLEAAGSTLNLDVEYYRQEIVNNGLIGVQPSTTAFLLRQARLEGRDFPEAEWALEKLVLENNGGVPHVALLGDFEIIFGLQFLLAVGIDARKNLKHGASKKVVEQFMKLRDASNSAFSSLGTFWDEFCRATATAVFEKFLDKNIYDKPITTSKTVDSIFDHVQPCHQLVTSNVPKKRRCRDYLWQEDSEHESSEMRHPFRSKKVCNNKVALTNTQSVISRASQESFSTSSFDASFLDSVQNNSKYFELLQLVLYSSNASDRLDAANYLIRTQHNDGGWGSDGSSSGEETAYGCVALFVLFCQEPEILEVIDFPKLVEFMNCADVQSGGSFWSLKVNFQTPILTELAFCAAKYAVFEMERLSVMTEIVNDVKLDTSEIEIFDEHGSLIFSGHVLRLQPELQLESIAVDKENMMQVITNDIFRGRPPSTHVKGFIEVSLELCYLTHPVKLSLSDRMTESLMSTYLFMIDDIIDRHLIDKTDVDDSLQELFDSIVAIMRNQNQTLSSEFFPNAQDYDCFVQMLHKCHDRNLMEQKGCDVSNYVKGFTTTLREIYTATHRDRCRDIAPTSERYLQLQSPGTGIKMMVEYYCILEGLAGSREFQNSSLYKKYIATASKAGRFIFDFPSVLKDVRESTLENYCLRLQHDYDMSIEEALVMTIKEFNQEILRMCVLKKIMLEDLTLKNDKELLVYLSLIESFVDGGLEWSLTNARYKTEWTQFANRRKHQNRSLSFVKNLCFSC